MPRIRHALFVAATAVLAPVLALAQGYGPPGAGGLITCESQGGDLRSCATPFRGSAVLVETLSETPCVEGRNWGVSGPGRVWVRDGCRARFADGAGGPPIGSRAETVEIRCESADHRLHECRVPARGQVRLVRQLSEAPCISGRTWGQSPGRVWVHQGCRAEFAVQVNPGAGFSGGNWTEPPDRTWNTPHRGRYSVTCGSQGRHMTTCAWDTRQGPPRLLEQLSQRDCRQGESWGTTADGDLWVSRGCRARFGVR